MNMDMQNEARVFGDGDVTIVVNMVTATARVYVGTQQIGWLQKLKLELDLTKPNPQLELSFPQSHDKNLSMKIEEQVRAVKQQVPWAIITR
jgi:hypothetical protein